MTPDSLSTQTRRTNPLSIVALVLSIAALANFVVAGFALAAIFAVGVGHVALQQITARGERGRPLALAALLIGYAIGVWAVATNISFWITYGLQGA